jgi:hypothetical protein
MIDLVLLGDPANQRGRLLPQPFSVEFADGSGADRRSGGLARERTSAACVVGAPSACAFAAGGGAAWPCRAASDPLQGGRLRSGRGDDGNHRVDRYGFAFVRANLRHTPAAGDGILRIDLVGGDLEERLVAVDASPDLLDPADDRPFGDRLAHLRHQYVAGIVSCPVGAGVRLDVDRGAVRGVRRLADGLAIVGCA